MRSLHRLSVFDRWCYCILKPFTQCYTSKHRWHNQYPLLHHVASHYSRGYVCGRVCVCVCVCLCVKERGREAEDVIFYECVWVCETKQARTVFKTWKSYKSCVFVHVYECMHAYMCVCVSTSMYERVCISSTADSPHPLILSGADFQHVCRAVLKLECQQLLWSVWPKNHNKY